MRWLSVGLALIMFGNAAQAQSPHWGPAGLPGSPEIAGDVWATVNGDTLYYGGLLSLGDMTWLTNRILRYTNGIWDTLPGVVPGTIYTIIQHNDTLFIGGGFTQLNGSPAGRIAYHDGNAWQPYGFFDSYISRLRVIDDTLYAVGVFSTADGNPVRGVGKRVGNAWLGVGQFAGNGVGVGDIARYNGELVVAGGWSLGSARSMFRLSGDQWLPLGQGLPGGWAGSLAVYNGDLYLSGQCTPAQGNIGKDIMRWDGTDYYPLGSGIQHSLGNNYTFCTPELLVHDDLLWVHSACYYAGGVPAAGMATWDGTQWCGVPGDIVSYGGPANAAFYQDTLFVTLFGDTADGVSVNRLAKFIGASYFDTCSGPVGLNDPGMIERTSISIVLIDQDLWEITGLEAGEYEIQLYDPLGRFVYQKRSVVSNGGSELINTSHISSGIYVVTVVDIKSSTRHKGLKFSVQR